MDQNLEIIESYWGMCIYIYTYMFIYNIYLHTYIVYLYNYTPK